MKRRGWAETPFPGSRREIHMATTSARPAALGDSAGAAPALDRDDRARLLRFMLLMRATEERALTLYRQGKVPGSYYDGHGQEAIGVGAAHSLRRRRRPPTTSARWIRSSARRPTGSPA